MTTPSQTVGPFYAIGLCRRADNELVPPGDPAAVELAGRLLDGAGDPVPDGLVEGWDDAGRRWGRSGTDRDGRFAFVVDRGCPHLDVLVFARGLLRHQRTRVYIGGSGDDELTARRHGDSLRFDINLQQTTFFA